MTADENRSLVQEFYDQWNSGSTDYFRPGRAGSSGDGGENPDELGDRPRACADGAP